MRVFSIVALAALVALTGCSAKKTVYSSNGSTVTTENNNKTVTVQSSGGTLTMGQNAVDLSKMNLPVYPGATQSEGGYSYNGSSGGGQMASLTTSDGFQKVYGWYKSHLPAGSQKMMTTSGDSSVAEFVIAQAGNGSPATAIMISSHGNQTSILMTKGTSK